MSGRGIAVGSGYEQNEDQNMSHINSDDITSESQQSPLPAKLYRYHSFSVNSLLGLKARALWFSSPKAFNDPYDCNTSFTMKKLTTEDYLPAFSEFRKKLRQRLPRNRQPEFDREWSHYKDASGYPNQRFKDIVDGEVRSRTEALLERIRTSGGVCCFSEEWNNPLLWSHYADGHRGFCLEFDTRFIPFSRARKVMYSASFPEVNAAAFSLRQQPLDDFMATLSTKHLSWKYENEWRVFHNEASTAFGYGIDALTAIFFGSEMPVEQIDILCHIVHGTQTRLAKVIRSRTDYSMTREDIPGYTPYDSEKCVHGRSKLDTEYNHD